MKNCICTALMAVCLFGLSAWCWFKPADEYSLTERRYLAQFPADASDFAEDFSDYAADQFPLRETFRTIHALFSLHVLGQTEVNGVYLAGNQIAAAEYPLDEASLDWALASFRSVQTRYLADNDVYFCIVPDKNYYLAQASGHLALDYAALFDRMEAGTADFCQMIDLTDLLSAEDYYRTDSHWRQEAILDVAARIAQTMGVELTDDWTPHTLPQPFRGVYYGQASVPVEPDRLTYLTAAWMDGATAVCLDNGSPEPMPLYDLEKSEGRDPYELFLSGSRALITLKNPNATTDRRLILFRDSFGSSLAPLLAGAYREVTLVDIRYASPAFLGKFVDFEGADVLYLYSTLVLNNARGQLLQ